MTDVFATVAEIVGKELPNNAAEDSFSLLPLLRGKPWARPRAAVTHHSIQGMFAIRDGRWKLVAGNGSGGREDPIGQPFERPYQLFDIASDPSEQSNVYDQHPAVAQRLERELERIRSWDRSRMTTDMAALVALLQRGEWCELEDKHELVERGAFGVALGLARCDHGRERPRHGTGSRLQ